MGGGVRYDPGGGGAPTVTTFTDSLIGVDQPFVAGDDWLPVFPVTDNTTTGQTLSAGINRGGTGLTMGNVTGAGFIPRGVFIPYPLDLSAVKSQIQFVEFKIVSNPGGVARLGGICYGNLNLGSYYEILTVTEASQLALNRLNAGGVTSLIAPSAATAYVNGDTLKMTADALTTPGTTILKLFKNGIQIGATVNDNAGARLTSGAIGLKFDGANPAVNITISSYRGGKV